jgi:hypothetical protein
MANVELGTLIESVLELHDAGETDRAMRVLERALDRIDGRPVPPRGEKAPPRKKAE